MVRVAIIAEALLTALGSTGCADDGGSSCTSGCPAGECGVSQWATICPDRFFMGAAEGDLRGASNETRHQVTLTRGFEILSTEVTQAEFEEAMGYNPSRFSESYGEPCGPDCPVEMVTWHEAVQYCNALSEREGLRPCYECSGVEEEARCELASGYASPYECEGYRLPTEAEWEHAARAGTSTMTWAGDYPRNLEECDDTYLVRGIAWYCGSGPSTHPVATLYANPWGLYDVLGNVAEWTADSYCGEWGDVCDIDTSDLGSDPVVDPWNAPSVDGRTVRGCGSNFEIDMCRSPARLGSRGAERFLDTGFRVARTRLDVRAER